jgi:hypothetical protein
LLAPNDFLRWKNEFKAQRGGLARARRSARVQPTIDWLGLDGLDCRRARRSVVRARRRAIRWRRCGPRPKRTSKRRARGANDRELRHDAIYDLGVARARGSRGDPRDDPEISGKPPSAADAAHAPAGAAGAPPANRPIRSNSRAPPT